MDFTPEFYDIFFFFFFLVGGGGGGGGVQEAGSLSFGWAPVIMIYGEVAEFETLHLPNASSSTDISELAVWSFRKTTVQ